MIKAFFFYDIWGRFFYVVLYIVLTHATSFYQLFCMKSTIFMLMLYGSVDLLYITYWTCIREWELSLCTRYIDQTLMDNSVLIVVKTFLRTFKQLLDPCKILRPWCLTSFCTIGQIVLHTSVIFCSSMNPEMFADTLLVISWLEITTLISIYFFDWQALIH